MEEVRPSYWEMTWAFRIEEAVAAAESYGRAVNGSFDTSPTYPGCPSCERSSVMQCHNCGGITCLASNARTGTCAWCGNSGRLDGVITSMRTGQT